MSINYNFVAVPQDMLSVLYQKHLTGNQLLVLLAVSEEVLKFPEGRASLTRELACRYIANKINISFQAVSRAIRKLVSMGLIEIIEVGKKSVGSLIKLIIPGAISETNIVAPSETHNEKCVASRRTNKRTLIKNVKEQTTGYDVAVSLNKNINSDLPSGENTGQVHNGNTSLESPPLAGETEEISFTPEKFTNTEFEKENTEPVNNDSVPETITVFGRVVKNNTGLHGVSPAVTPPLPKEEFKELSTVAAGIGIKPSLLSTGIKELAGRKCQDIKTTLEDILSQIKSRAAMIKKVPAYFVSLCQNVELEEYGKTGFKTEELTPDDGPDGPYNGGFKPLPAWLTDEPSSGCSSNSPVEPSPEEILQQKRHDFAEKISGYFHIGRVKYVLSASGVPQKIVSCSPDTLSYVKDGASLRHVEWKNLPEKLLNDIWFIGE